MNTLNHVYSQSDRRDHPDDAIASRGLPSLSPTFFIRPKTTGLVSLFIQVVILIVSATTSLFFFYHVGGFEYTEWNENSTILEPINHSNWNKKLKPVNPTDGSDSLVSTAERKLDFLEIPFLYNDSADAETVSLFLESPVSPNNFIENASFGIEQVPLTTVVIGEVEFDWLEVIRISTLVSIFISIIWLCSGLLFMCTIPCTILDTVILNTTALMLVVLFQLAHAGLITSLIWLQREMSWRTLSITIGSIVITFCCAFLGFVCICLNCGWIRYIDYMHGRKKCSLCSLFSLCCSKRDESTAIGNGRTPATYENDVPLDRFDPF